MGIGGLGEIGLERGKLLFGRPFFAGFDLTGLLAEFTRIPREDERDDSGACCQL